MDTDWPSPATITNHDRGPYALDVTRVSNIDEAAGIQNSRCYCDAGFGGRCCGVRATRTFDGCAIDGDSAHREDSPGTAFPANLLAHLDALGPIAGCHISSSDPDDTPRTGGPAGRRDRNRPTELDQPGPGRGRPPCTPMERVPCRDRSPERGSNGGAGLHLTHQRADAGSWLPHWFAGG